MNKTTYETREDLFRALRFWIITNAEGTFDVTLKGIYNLGFNKDVHTINDKRYTCVQLDNITVVTKHQKKGHFKAIKRFCIKTIQDYPTIFDAFSVGSVGNQHLREHLKKAGFLQNHSDWIMPVEKKPTMIKKEPTLKVDSHAFQIITIPAVLVNQVVQGMVDALSYTRDIVLCQPNNNSFIIGNHAELKRGEGTIITTNSPSYNSSSKNYVVQYDPLPNKKNPIRFLKEIKNSGTFMLTNLITHAMHMSKENATLIAALTRKSFTSVDNNYNTNGKVVTVESSQSDDDSDEESDTDY